VGINNAVQEAVDDADNEGLIKILNSKFTSNRAAYGGGIYALEASAWRIQDSEFSSNQAAISGGALYYGELCQAYINNSVFAANSAARQGGAVFIDSESVAEFRNLLFLHNFAAQGGAIFFIELDHQYFDEAMSFVGNTASLYGGAVFLLDSTVWSSKDSDGKAYTLFQNNTATFGSAIFVNASSDAIGDDDDDAMDEQGIKATRFAGNRAWAGGTVFWVWRGHTRGININSFSVDWGTNFAAYGNRTATQTILFSGAPIETVSINATNLLQTPFVFQLQDFYGQAVINSSSIVGTSIVDSHCDGRFSAFVNSSGSFPILNGLANFSSVLTQCEPGGNMTVSFKMETLSAPVTLLVDYKFRECLNGEYYSQGYCISCPKTEFSLVYTGKDTRCSSCADEPGVTECHSNVLQIQEGFWRQDPLTSAVIQCPDETTGCMGGDSTGQASCQLGSEGPLCAVCSAGYFNGGMTCIICGDSQKILGSESILLICLVFFACATAVFWYIYDPIGRYDAGNAGWFSTRVARTYRYASERSAYVQSKLKIIISTLQVVTATAETFTISLPPNITAFLNSLNFININIIGLVPAACVDPNFDFVDTLVLTTMVPIGLSFLLLLLYAAETAYRKNIVMVQMEQTNSVPGDVPLERALHNVEVKVRYQYWAWFLFLTYLVLPSVTTTIFAMFRCQNVNPEGQLQSYLVVDYSINCSSVRYDFGYYWAVTMLFVYPIGIPALYFVALVRNRRAIKDRPLVDDDEDEDNEPDAYADAANKTKAMAKEPPKRLKSLSFLYASYIGKYWYFELVETSRR
jgi:hypothetical protein